MLQITFKYVGQGDCIIVEWGDEDQPSIGIIDCHEVGGRNVAVNHLERKRPSKVEFIILSHPHEDHYSGLLSVLEHCEQSELPIGFFGHTARNHTQYLRAVLDNGRASRAALRKLGHTFAAIERFYKKGLIQKRGIVSDLAKAVSLGQEAKLRFLSPSEDEFNDYLASLYHPDLAEKTGPDTNIISTVTIIETEEQYILLTADATRKTLKRLIHGAFRRDNRRLILGQVPHHGSEKNHYRLFWRNCNHAAKTPLAISVGPNRYGHPSGEVVSQLKRLDYRVELTGATKLLTQKGRTSRALDAVSTRSPSSFTQASDLTYTF